MSNQVLDAIMGLCIADALGVPVEFRTRESLLKDPVVGMRSYGQYNQPAGTWSDDSSMTLCLADSLINGLDYKDIMTNFIKWYRKGEFTPFGKAFDIGIATGYALRRYEAGAPPLESGGKDEWHNGNGSLMRILPIVFYLQSTYGREFYTKYEAFDIIHNVSSLTHAHKRCLIACGIYISIAGRILESDDLIKAVKDGTYSAMKYYKNHEEFIEEIHHYKRLERDDFGQLPVNQISSTGYVVNTLEAAIWCLLNTTNYKDCVLKAVNLGKDTDTVGAVAGGLAGLYYGYDNIPKEWLDIIVKREYIEEICERLNKTYNKGCFLLY